MPAGIEGLLDIATFLEGQQGERYRAFVIHGPPLSGKTMFARKLARAANGIYIDVLATVANNPELASTVDLLDANYVRRLVVDSGRGAGIVVVDEFDFLVPTWDGDISELVEILRKLSVAETKAIVCFVLKTSPALESLTLTTVTGRSRILRLDEIKALA